LSERTGNFVADTYLIKKLQVTKSPSASPPPQPPPSPLQPTSLSLGIARHRPFHLSYTLIETSRSLIHAQNPNTLTLLVMMSDGGGRKLHAAALSGNAEELRKLLADPGADKDWTGDHDETPLFSSASIGHAGITSLLLEAGANVDKASRDGCTPLCRAAEKGHGEITSLLLEGGADKEKATTGDQRR
jgi:ankyrin repeat protein